MGARIRFRWGVVSVALLAGIATACENSPGPTYLALGDSLAVGVGADDPKTQGYVAGVHAWLQQNYDEDIDLHNLAVSGETSTTLVEDGQLEEALALIRERNGDDDARNDVVVITIDIGGNDLRGVVAEGGPCAPPRTIDATCLAAVSETLAETEANVPRALRALREAAGPDTTIVAATYYNPYSGSGLPLDIDAVDGALGALGEIILAAAVDSAVGAGVADFFTPFVGRSSDLTGLATPRGDFHPNSAGHEAMARAIIDVLAAEPGVEEEEGS